MSEYTPSQAEGERDDETPNGSGEIRHDPLPSTPSQAEGERETETEDEDGGDQQLPSGPSRPAAPPGPVTREHVRELLAAHDGSATLVLLEGRAQVIATAELNTDRYAGAVDVMSGDELARRTSTDSPSDHELDMFAGTLNTTVTQLGS